MSTAPEIDFDHHCIPAMQDPYPRYAELRRTCPVAHSSAHGGFYTVTKYDAVKRVYSDFQIFSSRGYSGIPPHAIEMLPINLDPPQHTRLRKIMNPSFEPAQVAAMRTRIQSVVDGLIDAFIEDGAAELGDQIVRPLLAAVVLPKIGVPLEDSTQIADWIDIMTHLRHSDIEAVAAAQGKIGRYLLALVARRRTQTPSDDLLGVLISSRPNGVALTDDEIFRTILIVLFGGLDTTSAVMLDAIVHLVRTPEDAKALLGGEADWAKAIEEFIRYTSPVQGLRRNASVAVELEGVEIPEGAAVLTLNASANRDPEVFDQPDRCLIGRERNEHLAFGSGAHVCIGRHLARVEIEIFLKTVLTRLRSIAIAPDFAPEYAVGATRGLKRLPITFTPGARLSETSGTTRAAAS
jgi:cytochrome P450